MVYCERACETAMRLPCPFYYGICLVVTDLTVALAVLPMNKRRFNAFNALDTLLSTFDSTSFQQLNGLSLQYSRSPSEVGVQK